ncbi:transmembrane protein, putative (macronuclear) [Tetrahymena thermophila SB210]|uniref:Transmembrane protein, putative n=1 Tax=Tetrahymena thermophila (strain SB210) TaxID=312017 RepID=Q22UA4_TETTS|nr:transmembrane protein, putative [Tetrahymena thermophila SB210]EAR88783.1 transmembrane protein, putative [Tetrahymena thermophila SB210]|eukprot:XP_001009028.1 transmembrane protein, putative [Tetrahymena thermophila SB210]
MSKTIILALLLAQIITLAFAASSVTCGTHPLLNKVQSSVNSLVATDTSGKAKTKSDALFKSFTNAKPSSKSAADLGVCSAYAGQNSCCDKNIVKLIDQAALQKAKPIQTKSTVFQKFTNIYAAQANKLCSKYITNGPVTADAILKNAALTSFQALKTSQATCKINFAKALTSFTRGALCTVCSGVDKVNDYVNAQGQLKVTQDSVNQFVSATDTAATCFANIFTGDAFKATINELNGKYISDATCASSVLTKIQTVFTNKIIQNSDGNGGKLCKGTTVFGNNAACESLLQGDANLESNNSRLLRSEDDEMFRLLDASAAPDAVVDPQGVSVYTTSSTDSSIDENGSNISTSFDNVSTTSSEIIKAALALISLLALAF